METARIAKSFQGDDLYKERARAALPILVRQAHADAKIYYSELAHELGMPNPRNLNFPLGSIGTSLEELSKQWGETIPPIQCLVVNRATGLPGDGIDWFVRDIGEFKGLSLRKRQAILDGVLAKVFAYPRWNEVLKAFGLSPVSTGYAEIIDRAATYGTGAESDLHKALKKYVAMNPQIVGLPIHIGNGESEYGLPSGDCVDVFFTHAAVRTAVEVKSRISNDTDIVRGIFQCVKYRAVLMACIAAENSDDSADVVLVLEGALPGSLRVLRNILDIKVIENVSVPA